METVTAQQAFNIVYPPKKNYTAEEVLQIVFRDIVSQSGQKRTSVAYYNFFEEMDEKSRQEVVDKLRELGYSVIRATQLEDSSFNRWVIDWSNPLPLNEGK